MCNCIIHGLKITIFIAFASLMLACGSSTKQGSSEFADPTQNLDAILKQAAEASPATKNPLLVQAAGILITSQRQDKALELLIHIEDEYLTALQKDSFHLYYGEALLVRSIELAPHSTEQTLFPVTSNEQNIDNADERNRAALTQLLTINKPSAHSVEWQIRYFQSLSDAYFENHNYFEAAKQRIDLDDLINQEAVLAENNERIWLAISKMSNGFLQQTMTDFNSQRVNGWLEIVYLNQKWGNQPDQLLIEMEIWKQKYPLHPAMVVQPKMLQRLAIVEELKPKKIAVLLPLSGRLAKPGKIIQEGIIAAHYQSSEIDAIPSLRFYNTAESFTGLTSYQQAVADGAEFIIGPLNKKTIDQVISQEQLSTPTLFLNSANSQQYRHPMAFQFVLSIEDKAIQAAHRAWEKDYRKAILFLPNTAQGQRAEVAFKQYFEQLGGEVLDSQNYSDIKKLKNNVQKLLGIDDSLQRKSELEKILGRNIEFEMRRRQDADFIFMLAKPSDARRIKPFIDFYFALDLPVISTSNIFAGKVDPQLDNDLNGIEFSDIPLYISQQSNILLTRENLSSIDPKLIKGGNGRLFSLGFDAYQLIPQLTKLQAFPEYRWYGLSGEIGIDDAGLVHRYLTWAKFENGIPKVTKERIPPVKQTAKPVPDLIQNADNQTSHFSNSR